MRFPPTPSSTASPRKSEAWLLALLTLAAAALQATRLPFRWNAICVAYASYFKEYQHNIEIDGPAAAFTTFVGLHPPLYSLLFHTQESLAVAPVVWLSVSGVLSVGSVPLIWFAARRWFPSSSSVPWVAATVLAVSPHRVAYGLEINNYPLMVCTTTAQLVAFVHYAAVLSTPSSRARRAGSIWMLTTVLALWTHVLAVTLPAAQLLAFLLLPSARPHLKNALKWMSVAALPCLVLLPKLLSGGEAPPINDSVGLVRGLESLLVGFPGRYGSAAGSYILGTAGVIGVYFTLQAKGKADRLVGTGILLHLTITAGLIVVMVSSGTAAAHQFPYYLALLPGAALIIAAAVAEFRHALLARSALGLILVGLALHGFSLGGDALAGAHSSRTAPTERALMAVAIEEWTPGSSLVLIDFPHWGDDDKDILDPTWALVPMMEAVDFAHPGVPTLVTGDPYWGQPVRFGGNRWLYTFTSWPPQDGPVERMDVIAGHVLSSGSKLIVAIYNTDKAYGDFAQAEAWAMRQGQLGRSATSQALWVIPAEPEESSREP